MLRDISVLLDRVALKSSRLIGNFTTNLVESWMSVRSKFDGGKIYNRCNRGSWHSRCYGGSLRKSIGPAWSVKVWERSTGTSAGKYFRRLYENRKKALNTTKVTQAKPESKKKRYKRKLERCRESNSKRAKVEYGSRCLEAAPEISKEKMEELKTSYMEKHLNLSNDKVKAVEVITRRQSASTVWRDERKKRITSSNFGNVCKRNPNIKVKALVKQLVYPSFKGNIYTRKGIHDESMTIREYESRKEEEGSPVKVEPVGLVICQDNQFLATSPDGRVLQRNGEIGLIEIKNLLHNKPVNLYEAAKNNNSFCLEIYNKKLQLKRNHNYFYQVQGQLNILKLPWVDFVARTERPYQLHVERISRDETLWTNIMLPKLKAFYLHAVLPELVAPTFNTVSGIREPGCWYTEEKRSTKQLKQKGAKKTGVGTKDKGISTAGSSADTTLHSTPADNLATSTDTSAIPSTSTSADNTLTVKSTETSATLSTSSISNIRSRSRRRQKVKFVGRRIAHEWIEDDTNNIKKWYNGTVMCTLTGVDGDENAVYEILYDGDDEPYSVENLLKDYQASSLKFIDL